ncbi:hypothetical protein NX059_012109 [Plenodomus lindquistii]|nr:hypothetical protein NX059_012109 [Plenodomus lindquistii]
MIYAHTYGSPKQALLVHRPRLASLRPRTRQDRSRPLASEIEGHEQDKKLELTKSSRGFRPNNSGGLARDSNRPFFGLTQVCRAIRYEYRPIYLRRQEIGMDLTEIIKYLHTFYADAAKELGAIEAPGVREKDLDYTGNFTIAVGDKTNAIERSVSGVDVFPLLDLWANSYKIEAGFGRYMNAAYVPEHDGEAKDLYRLFGRRVLANRSCSIMNPKWRTILRTRALAAVFVHRHPARPATPFAGALSQLGHHPLAGNGAYLHVVFKKATAEPWMTAFESNVPPTWLAERGFLSMEYFDIRVGVEQ